MAFAFAVFLIVAASVSATPLGQEKCSWGPSYWCESYKQAVECKALEHCRTKVWALKNEAACEICELVVPKIKDYLSKNSTQTDVITALEGACNALGQFAQMCKSLVDQYEPVIMNNLEEFLSNPQQVCTLLGLCQAKQSNKVAAKLILSSLPLKQLHLAAKPAVLKSKPYRASPQCILCEFVMDKLKTALTKPSTEKEITQALEQVCSNLPSSVVNECKDFVDKYSAAIFDILAQELDPEKVCATLGLCASEEHRKAMEKPVTLVVGSNETCEICETVMTYLKNLLADNATKQEILSLLEQICNYLPSQVASECNAIISEYGPAILDLIAGTDPHTLCQEIGLCDAALLKKHEGDFCFLGASFWCANKRNAEKCGVMKYCTDHVWN